MPLSAVMTLIRWCSAPICSPCEYMAVLNQSERKFALSPSFSCCCFQLLQHQWLFSKPPVPPFFWTGARARWQLNNLYLCAPTGFWGNPREIERTSPISQMRPPRGKKLIYPRDGTLPNNNSHHVGLNTQNIMCICMRATGVGARKEHGRANLMLWEGKNIPYHQKIVTIS